MLDPVPSRARRQELDAWHRAAAWVPLVCFAAYLALAIHTLRVAHPMEDAYILFHYVENFAAGKGIVFNTGGPHAEGATDFLWFALLSVFVKCGVNVAVAACVLNAAGAALASFVCVRAVRASDCRGPWSLVLALLSLPVVLIGGALAGYVGFSAMLYSALALLVFATAVAGRPKSLVWIPLLGLVLGLFRPDGVLLGAAYTLLGFFAARRAQILRPYVARAIVAVTLGATYFAWRYHYFGLLWPLPLYVKENTSPAADLVTVLFHPRLYLSGFVSNMVWLESALGPRNLGVCALLLAFIAGCSWQYLRKLLLQLAPSILLFAALCFVRQTQNIAFRFQAPLLLVVFYAAYLLLVQTCANRRSSWLRGAACLLFATASWTIISPTIARLKSTWRLHSYMDTFPTSLGRALEPGRVIALTDAGRIPYWTDARVEDIVGLNTPSAALVPPTYADIEALAPDIVMFNTSNVFNFPGPVDKERPVIRLTPEEFRAALDPACSEAFDGGPPPSGIYSTRENLAPLRLGRLLHAHPEYEAYAVAFGAAYCHVWGFRRDLAELPAILRALEEASSGAKYRSYLELVEERSSESERRAGK